MVSGFIDEVTASTAHNTPAGLLRTGFIKIDSKGLEIEQYRANLQSLLVEFQLKTLSPEDLKASKGVVENYRRKLESFGENEKSDAVRDIFCPLLDCNPVENTDGPRIRK